MTHEHWPPTIPARFKSYRAYYARAKGGDGDAYTMDHSAFLYLLDRQGKVAEVLPHATPADRLAAALTNLLDQPAAAASLAR